MPRRVEIMINIRKAAVWVLSFVLTYVALTLLLGCAGQKVYPVDVHLAGGCCIDDRCVWVDGAVCKRNGGVFMGQGIPCDPEVCSE